MPDGIKVCGLNVQLAPAGNPEHANPTTLMNPFSGVTVSVTVPVEARFTVNDDAELPNVKSGGGLVTVSVTFVDCVAVVTQLR